MDIRTKLVFAMVAVALGSMAALAVTAYRTVGGHLEETRIAQLSGLAEFKVESLEGILEGWYDRLSLVATRNELRSALAAYDGSSNPSGVARLQEILDNVRRASPTFQGIAIHGPTGAEIATSPSGLRHTPADLDLALLSDRERPTFLGVVFPAADGAPLASLAAPIELDAERIGYVHALLAMDEIEELSRSYEGLGDTGETMVVTRQDDEIRVLHPVRAAPVPDDTTFDPSAFQGAGLRMAEGGLATLALQNEEEERFGDITDYRGQEVWVATDYLAETGWGVVVKVDAAEQTEPIEEIRDRLVQLVTMLAAFAIVAGTLLGFRFAQPIHLLAEAANRIRQGDLTARTGIEQEDEVGLLAQTFDKMAGELEEQVALLTEYRRFFDMALDPMCIADTDGYFKKVNAAWTRELGWSEEELLSRPFVSFVHPDDVDKTVEEVAKLEEGYPTIRFENRYLAKDGSYKLIRWRSTPEQGTGRVYALARVKGTVEEAPEAEPGPTEAPEAEAGDPQSGARDG